MNARDLAGHPLAGASVRAVVHYGARLQTYHLRKTDQSGRTALTFRPPGGITRTNAVVNISIENGFLSIALTTKFSVGSVPARAVASPSATAVSQKSGASTPVSKKSIVTVARALPPAVTAPDPAWVVVYAHDQKGAAVVGASVEAVARFNEGDVRANGSTDDSGVATVRLDTTAVRAAENVQVTAQVTLGSASGSATTEVAVSPAPTPTPTLTPAPPVQVLAAPVPTPTPTPTPIAMDQLTPPLDRPTPTATPSPTFTPVPTPTNTPLPTPTNTPGTIYIGTPTTGTSAGSTTSAGTANCPGSQSGCMQAMLNILNQTRAQHGVAPLSLNLTESNGTATCVGSYGHSVHMAQMGQISHDQFPADVCVGTMVYGENVGQWSGDELYALQSIHNEMMSEPYTPGCLGTHVCNILSSQYHQVGIGIYYVNGIAWLTEDFLG